MSAANNNKRKEFEEYEFLCSDDCFEQGKKKKKYFCKIHAEKQIELNKEFDQPIYVNENGSINVRGWYARNESEDATKDLVIEFIEKHIDCCCSHFKGKIISNLARIN